MLVKSMTIGRLRERRLPRSASRARADSGAGSTVFTRNLIGDVLGHPELADGTTFVLISLS